MRTGFLLEGVERARAASRVSVLRTRMGEEGRRGQYFGSKGGRFWRSWPAAGACGVEARRRGRRDFVSAAVAARSMRRVEEGEVGRRGGEREILDRRVGWRSRLDVLDEIVVMEGVSSPGVVEEAGAGWGFVK